MKITVYTTDTNEKIFDEEYLDKSNTNGLVERSMNLENRYLTCSLSEMNLKDIYIQYGECQLHNDVKVLTTYNAPLLTMYFNLKGNIKANDSEMLGVFTVNENEFCIVYNYPEERKINITRNQHMKYLCINILPQYFFQNVKDHLLTAESVFMHLQLLFPSQKKISGTITSDMLQVIRQLVNCESKGLVKAIFIKSKVLELLALQLQELEVLKRKTKQYSINSSDIEKLYHAREVLKKRISDPPTIKELAKLVSINEFKLKKGFREIFDNTVYGIVFDYRMKVARQMLQETTKSISDIAEHVGYNYSHHFSKAFKQKYNLLPRELRRKKNS